jgi:ABC-type uncharacterized transport system permease subunit
VIIEERNKAIASIVPSLSGMVAIFLMRNRFEQWEVDSAWLLLAGLVLFFVYAWGCSCLAFAKGHSSAIVLTAVFGVLPPLIALMLMPDVNRHLTKRPKPAAD